MESKKEIYDIIPPAYYPKTLFFKAGTPFSTIVQQLAGQGFTYPLIAKPDIGMRGLSVKKMENVDDLLQYAAASDVDYLVQQFVAFDKEVGIFYYRYPGEARGHISGIVEKEFLTVTGDGRSSIEELLKRDKRFVLQLPVLKASFKSLMTEVPAAGEEKLLVPYGNHARGAKFINISHLADEELTNTMDAICRQVPGFYYGRLDIKYSNWQQLKQGENFSIIELNGAGSEPTHMYDPRQSIFFAWKEIIRHWNILFRISLLNHRQKKLPYMRFSSGIQMFRDNSAYVSKISNS